MLEWSVGDIVRKWAQMQPDKVAFVCDDKPATYRELNDKANRVAQCLQAKGMKKGDRIAILTRNCVEFLEIFFAGAKLGLILVPLNFRLLTRELQYQLNDAGVRLLFFHDAFTENVQQLRPETGVEQYIVIKSSEEAAPAWAQVYHDAMKSQSPEEPVPDQLVNLTEPLTIIYTSGTTGNPKGAVLTHLQTYFKCFQIMTYTDMKANDVFLDVQPLFHSGGLFIQTLPSLCRGATVVTGQRLDPKQFCRSIEKYKVTIILALTSMWRIILRSGELEHTDTSSVRVVFGGGERTPISMFHELEKYGLHMQSGFGLTENSKCATLPARDIHRKMGSAGLPGFFTDLWIEDERGNKLPPGQTGEIVCRGPNVMEGYWNLPDKTAETIVGGVLHTGDLGYMDEDGYLYIVDRLKDMYRSGGENVYPAEIEKLLYEHPKIAEVSIIGVNDETWGETGKAFVVLKDKKEGLTIEELHDFLKEKASKYKWPSSVQVMDSLPMTESGKIKKNELKEKYGVTLLELENGRN